MGEQIPTKAHARSVIRRASPFLQMAPLMFADAPEDRITMGTLMKVSMAFDKLFGARWPWSPRPGPKVHDFRSTGSGSFRKKNAPLRGVPRMFCGMLSRLLVDIDIA